MEATVFSSSLDPEIKNSVISKSRDIPVLGSSPSKGTALLFHYSTNENISEFEYRPGIFCWTRLLADKFEEVQMATQCIDYERFSAIYFIKLGVFCCNDIFFEKNSIIARSGVARGSIEYELSRSLAGGYFEKILVTPDIQKSCFTLR